VSVTQPDGTFHFSQLAPSLFNLFVTVDGHRIAFHSPSLWKQATSSLP
jgi:hypothetical protein